MTHVNFSRKAGFFAPVALLVLVSFLFTTVNVNAQEIDYNDEFDIPQEFLDSLDQYICHATDDVNEPFVLVTVGEMFIDWGDDKSVEHFIHSKDIVPTVSTTQDTLDLLEIPFPGITELLEAGLNLDTEYPEYGMTGQQIHDAGCEASLVEDDSATSTSTENIPATTTENTENSESSENNENTETPTQFACEIEGHKYDQNGAPLPEWQIGLMKIITQGENTDIWDLANDMTDSDGYYCLEWDGETRELRGDTPTINDLPYDFTYHVYEKLVDGWNFLSIEKGADVSGLVVVDENEIRYDGEYISTQVGEINGYIYADSAYHVDFYNYKDAEVVPVVEEENRSSGSSGTRVGDRNRGGSNPQPKVLGEATSTLPLIAGNQVTLVPTGAPDTGAGGTSNVNTLGISNILFIGRRF